MQCHNSAVQGQESCRRGPPPPLAARKKGNECSNMPALTPATMSAKAEASNNMEGTMSWREKARFK
jgi:hypothetical protein